MTVNMYLLNFWFLYQWHIFECLFYVKTVCWREITSLEGISPPFWTLGQVFSCLEVIGLFEGHLVCLPYSEPHSFRVSADFIREIEIILDFFLFCFFQEEAPETPAGSDAFISMLVNGIDWFLPYGKVLIFRQVHLLYVVKRCILALQ